MLYRFVTFIELDSEELAVELIGPIGDAMCHPHGCVERDYVTFLGEVDAPPDWKQLVLEAITVETSMDLDGWEADAGARAAAL